MTRIISERVARINERTGRTEIVLLYLKYVDDVLAASPTFAGRSTGISLRVLARTLPDGRTSVAATLYQRVNRQRASGKAFHYWTPVKQQSMSRTKQGLVVMRDLNHANGKMQSIHQWAEKDGLNMWIENLGREFLYTFRNMENRRVLEGPNVGDNTGVLELEIENAGAAARAHLGELPSFVERLPLLNRELARGRGLTLIDPSAARGVMLQAYLDAEDHSQVAKKLFGIRNYRRPLVQEIQRLDAGTLTWFTQFRGLVPIEWIIDAMRGTLRRTRGRYDTPPTSLQWRQIRAILRRTPAPILGRILKESPVQAERTLVDAANATRHVHAQLRDLDRLPELIQARGQRRVRDSRDLEHLVRSLPEQERWTAPRRRAAEKVMAEEMYEHQEMERFNREVPHLPAELGIEAATWSQWKNDEFRQRALGLLEEHRRTIMNERQRLAEERRERERLARIQKQADRAAWAEQATKRLHGLEVAPGLVLEVAADAQTLARWGAVMNNCIGGYAYELGLDVLAAVVEQETGTVRLNLQIDIEHGVVQFLGKNNRDAVSALPQDVAQQIVDAITDAGVPFSDDALGMRGLRARELQAA